MFLWVSLGYLLSRVIFWFAAGIRFDASPINSFWQYVDPQLLRDDPLKSIYYLHSQLPLFNLYHAGVLFLAGGDPTLLYWASFVVFGFILHAAIYGLLIALGVRVSVAAAATLLFALSPASILYESWLFYTYPLAALLTCAALALFRLIARGGRTLDALLFFGLLGVAGLTRSTFHLAWILVIIALVTALLRTHWKRLLLCASLPVFLVASVYIKNGVEFDSFSSSTWLGMHLARISTATIPLNQRRELYNQGIIGAVSLVPPFSPLERYPLEYRTAHGVDHPVLQAPRKTTDSTNFNHIAYIEISRAYFWDALTLIQRFPAQYASNVAIAWLNFSLPPSENGLFIPNRERIANYVSAWDVIIYGVVSIFRSDVVKNRRDPGYLTYRFSWTWAVLAIFAIAQALTQSIRRLLHGEHSAQSVTLLFMSLTILYVATLGNAIELGENNRFRFMIEPLIVVLIVRYLDTSVINSLLRWRGEKRIAWTPPPS